MRTADLKVFEKCQQVHQIFKSGSFMLLLVPLGVGSTSKSAICCRASSRLYLTFSSSGSSSAAYPAVFYSVLRLCARSFGDDSPKTLNRRYKSALPSKAKCS